jgi:Icc protein
MGIHQNNCQSVRELFSNLPAGSLKILQITDTHLYEDTASTLLGMNTQLALDEVLKLANECGQVDLILTTGDLVHDASEKGYKRFQSIMEAAGVPVYCLPGNHDIPQAMKQYLVNSAVRYIPSARHAGWLFIFLDSTVAGSEGGHLAEAELELLESTLKENPDLHALVCLHHHPVPMNSGWMDTMLIDNPEPFFKIIDSHMNVQGILWGHVHQEFDKERMGVRLMASPSTCIQFTPEKDDFGVDNEPPGCRWLALLPSGEIRTCVTRLASMPAGLDVHSAGY